MEDFCYYLRNMKNLHVVTEKGMSELNRLLLKSGEISNYTPQERVKYINDMTTKRDIENQIEYAMEKGMEKGRLDTARNLKNLGVPTDTICEATGLTKEQVIAL